MLENRMVTPFADDDVKMIDEPHGLTSLRRLPNETANVVFYDELWHEDPNGKPWIATILDHALRAHASVKKNSCDQIINFEVESLKLLFAVIEAATAAGKRAFEDDYLRMEMEL